MFKLLCKQAFYNRQWFYFKFSQITSSLRSRKDVPYLKNKHALKITITLFNIVTFFEQVSFLAIPRNFLQTQEKKVKSQLSTPDYPKTIDIYLYDAKWLTNARE